MAKPITSFDRTCDWNGNRLEVNLNGKYSYIVTFDHGLNHIPLQNLCTWLSKVEHVISARLEFVKELTHIKEDAIHKREMEAYRFSSKLYNQMCNIAHIENISSIDLMASVTELEDVDPPSLNLRDRCYYLKSNGVVFVGPHGLSEVEQAEVEKNCLGIKKVVEKTLEQLDTVTIYQRPTIGNPIADFREFNTTFDRAKETFDILEIVKVWTK
ncbi:MAG TPA: hypothetical protein VLG76_07960 [Rhabdochlamydiaceae bacterium]|nr:hypothetical protein [Rhabdochlamydiaceae bacterium]